MWSVWQEKISAENLSFSGFGLKITFNEPLSSYDKIMYETNSPQIVAETIDNEVMAIDFEHGFYFSLRDSAAAIWTLVVAHQSIPNIVARLEPHLHNASRLVPDFIRQLEQEKLIRPSTAVAIDVLPELKSYQPPELERFDDMQAMLLLDPIHEVEPKKGWPFAAKKI